MFFSVSVGVIPVVIFYINFRSFIMSEILGALFKYLVALLGVGAVVVILYQVFSTNKTQNAISDLTQLQANSQALYNGQNTFTTLTNTVAVSGKLATASMIAGSSNLQNPWGGVVTINVNSGNASQFDITETAVPQDACAKMLVGLPTVVALKVNGTSQTLPLDAGTAVVACSVATTAGNTLIYTFAH